MTTEIVDPVSNAASRCLVACRMARRSNPRLDSDAGAGQHVDKSLDAEEIDFPAKKIADPGLSYSEKLRGGILRQLARPDQAPDFTCEWRKNGVQAIRRPVPLPTSSLNFLKVATHPACSSS
jgi:hypothetical protein